MLFMNVFAGNGASANGRGTGQGNASNVANPGMRRDSNRRPPRRGLGRDQALRRLLGGRNANRRRGIRRDG